MFNISDDDDSEIEASAAALPTLHHLNTLDKPRNDPIDLTSDSDGEWLAAIGRSRPSHVPQPMKRIRLGPVAHSPAVVHNKTIPVLHSQAPSFKPISHIGNPVSPANRRDGLSTSYATGHRPPVTRTNLNAINTAVPPLPGSRMKASRKKPKSKPVCPYFDDPELEVRMYRGTGYERFPVALGTINDHQIICDKWDAAQQRKLQKQKSKLLQLPDFTHRRGHSDSEASSDSDESTDEDEGGTTHFDQQCLDAVLEVFPDVQHQFVLDSILKHPRRMSKVGDGTAESIITQAVITELLELEAYPKQPKVVKKDVLPEDATGKTITWNRDLPKGHMYLKDAVILLAKIFDHIPTCHISKIVNEKQSIFDAYITLNEQETKYFQKEKNEKSPYARLRMPRVAIEKKYQPTAREHRLPHSYAQRINELQAAKQHIAREAIKASIRKTKEAAEDRNLEEHKAIGATVQCGCCFEETVPLNRVVPCEGDSAHSFCFSCVSGLADTQVGLMKHELKCMDASACSASLSWSAVAKALDIKTFDRLEFNKQQAEIMAAGLEGLEQCPFCDFKAICDDVEVDPVFACQNPGCEVVSCRKCRLESHLPKTCEQHKKENDLTALHRVEEARSDAVMRTCPKCKVKIMKEDGCNKMICSTCRTYMCYECQEDLSKLGPNVYDHFNKPGAKCSLYDRVGVNRHEVEADDAEREAIRKAKEEDGSIDEARLRVETGKSKPTPLQMHPAHDLLTRHGVLLDRRLNDLAQQRHVLRVAEQERMAERRLFLRQARQIQRAERYMGPPYDPMSEQLIHQYPEFRNQFARPYLVDQVVAPAVGNQPNRFPGTDIDKTWGEGDGLQALYASSHPAKINNVTVQPSVTAKKHVPPVMPPTQPDLFNLPPYFGATVPANTDPTTLSPLAASRVRAWAFPPAMLPPSWAPGGNFGAGPMNGPGHVQPKELPTYARLGLTTNEAREFLGTFANYPVPDDYGFQEIFGHQRPAV